MAVLDLPFKTEAEYIASLSANMRSNLRRKLKLAAKVQVEICTDITKVEAELLALRRHTQENAKANYGDFEELAPGYFRAVMEQLGDDARLLLYRVEGELIGFSLVLLGAHELIYKYTGMRYPAATDHGVYFLNWMVMVRHVSRARHSPPARRRDDLRHEDAARLQARAVVDLLPSSQRFLERHSSRSLVL